MQVVGLLGGLLDMRITLYTSAMISGVFISALDIWAYIVGGSSFEITADSGALLKQALSASISFFKLLRYFSVYSSFLRFWSGYFLGSAAKRC